MQNPFHYILCRWQMIVLCLIIVWMYSVYLSSQVCTPLPDPSLSGWYSGTLPGSQVGLQDIYLFSNHLICLLLLFLIRLYQLLTQPSLYAKSILLRIRQLGLGPCPYKMQSKSTTRSKQHLPSQKINQYCTLFSCLSQQTVIVK